MAKPLTQIAFDFSAPEEPVQQVEQAELPVTPEQSLDQKEDTPEVIPSGAASTTLSEDAPLPVEPVMKVARSSRKETTAHTIVKKRGRRSLKDNTAAADLIQVPDDEQLFKKQYYSIGEVARMFRENQSLIRFWETEFDILQPRKNRKGDRFFRPVDIKNLVLIHDLLRRRKFTIEGAREYLKKNNAQNIPGKADEKFELIQSLQRIRSFLLELKASL